MEMVDLQVTIKGEFRVYSITFEESEEIQKVLDNAPEETVEQQLEELLKGKKITAFSKDGSFDKITHMPIFNKTIH